MSKAAFSCRVEELSGEYAELVESGFLSVWRVWSQSRSYVSPFTDTHCYLPHPYSGMGLVTTISPCIPAFAWAGMAHPIL